MERKGEEDDNRTHSRNLSVSCTVDDDWFLGGARELHPLVYDK